MRVLFFYIFYLLFVVVVVVASYFADFFYYNYFFPFFSFGCAHLRKRGSVATPLRASTRNGVSNELILLGFTESDRVLSSSATFQIGFSLKA